jgi:general secretion pathway protein K
MMVTSVSTWRIQRGVALIAVLWLVAAMSLIITGIVQSVRSEIRTVGIQRQAVIANALADAGILLALQNLQVQQKEPGAAIQLIPVQFEGLSARVSVQPLNGLIDINNAAPLLLADLYRHAGGLSADVAQAMAQATVESRQFKNGKGEAQGFEAVEDLLRVPKMTYDLYVKIRPLMTADLKDGTGRVNALAAPAGVLQVLTGGDVARAASLVARRAADPSVMDTSFLKPEHVEMAPSRTLRLQVQVDLADGAAALRMWLVYWGTDPRSGLPWRVLGTQQSMQRPASSPTL